jgi:hypothetical protein
MIPEAPSEKTEHGITANGEGWFLVNAREAPWWYREGRGAYCELEGKPGFEQLGISPVMLARGEAMAMYHWQADQEDFLVVSGEALLIIEGEERPLRAWDFALPAPNEARHRRRRRWAVRCHRDRWATASGRSGLGRLYGRRSGVAPWRRRRGGDERSAAGVRAI